MARQEAEWYCIDGTAYCPACVECDTPAIDAAAATTGPCGGNSTCGCCGESYGGWATEVIESHLGESRCTADNPRGAAAYFDESEYLQWRIADDQTSDRYRTVDEAIGGAKAWREAMKN